MKYSLIKQRLKSTNLLYLLMIPLVTLLALQIFYNGDLFSVYAWIIEYPKQFLVSYILMFGIINIFYGLPRKAYLAICSILFGLFSILGYISRQKLNIKGSPLLPTDFSIAKEAIEISGRFKDVYIWMALIAIGALVLIVLMLKFTPREKYKWQQKTAVFLTSLTLLTLFYTAFGPIKKAFALQLNNLSQKINYEENGMMLGFALNAEYLKVQEPANYQEDSIKQVVEGSKASYSTDPDFKPNIIFVMSEAFWDPTLMKNVSFNQDPMPFFRSLQKSQTSGTMLSPVYGGGTANTEFEVLTGFSTQFLPNGAIPYAQYVNKPIEALPTILQRQGYATSAIHTYDNWFYNRNNVYKDLGFDKFISKEYFNSPEYKGSYIRDTELTKKILEEVKATDKSDFIYATSMQAHGPYSSTPNPENQIKVSGSNLSPASQAILENYSNTVADVDQSLKQLIEGLEQSGEPTEVIFYGDHLPMLGDDYSVYKEAGFIKGDNSYQENIDLHSVPFVTWNNFSTTKQDLSLSSNFLGTYALQLAQKSGSPMTDFLSNLLQKDSDVVINQDYPSQEKITPTEVTQYKLLQYDLMFGEEFTNLLEPSHKPSTNTAYIQGEGPVKITKAVITAGLLTIEGENFSQNDKVYIDGKTIDSTFANPKGLSASLPKDFSGKSGTVDVQIKLSDSMSNVISQSNVYQLPVSN
ncbi:LTA synthase family protein [Desulfosporosinus fructosivorans]|uniref:LTA synthase family protein n=1 Tax=Desulfosporosinus fructosivorans TaxID=2018669 RepID=A0A4Z0R3X0_9FIRM|nr:LTA synthase family protein [Desulfosporosinus fructosivorans]TGE36316.1 LTA synthase family protein [Desulfosporosinus fructosivorans]